MPVAKLNVGAKVRLKSAPALKCAVVGGPNAQDDRWEYEVLIDGDYRTVDEGQLEAADAASELRWVTGVNESIIQLLLTKLQNPQTDALYSYRASRTEFEPYQFRPALKFLRNISRGLLIADEVGLGKTIEAAIIYLELKARVDASRVLILCPSRLCQKWQDELQNRFGETFEIWDSKRARDHLDRVAKGIGGDTKAIASFETMRNPDLFHRWGELGISLDLLIVDEAHNLRNEGTRQHQLGVVLSQSADAVVLLSATPLHLGNKDLYNLLHLIAPDEFSDLKHFEALVAPNAFINEAIRFVSKQEFRSALKVLRRVETTSLRERYTRNPYYREAVDFLQSKRDTLPSKRDAVFVQGLLSDLNTLSSVLTRTRKREMTQAAVRAAHSVIVTLNDSERALYSRALNRTEAQMRSRPTKSNGFGAVMEERQAASSLPAYAKRVSQGNGATPLDVDVSQFDISADDDVQPTIVASRNSALQIGPGDSKLDKLLEILYPTVEEGPQSKVLIFSFFRGTIDYLRSELTKRGFAPLVLHGGVKMPQRYQIIDEFKREAKRQILISSEVGAEGLDFQFCNVLVNYDLPWNPMQVEQRIGRLDRFGQRSPKIRIYNFFIADTIETRILQRLFERIKIFQRSIGDLEEILGQEIRSMTEMALTGGLSPMDQERLADDAALRILRRQRANDELEAEKDKLLGQGQLLDSRIQTAVNSGRTIASTEVRVLVLSFIEREFPTTLWDEDHEIDCGVLDVDPKLRDHLRRFIERRNLRASVSDHLGQVLAGSRKLRVTFDSDVARQAPDLDFVTVSHPLAVAARVYWETQNVLGVPCSPLKVKSALSESGRGAYFVYEVHVSAVEETVTMEPVVIMENGSYAEGASRRLLRLLQSTADHEHSSDRDTQFVEDQRRRAETIVSRKRAAMEAEALDRNAALLVAREVSIRTSFDAKISRAKRLAGEDLDERIKRMYAAQAIGLEVKRDAKLEELRQRGKVAVTSRLVLAGTLQLGETDRAS